MTDTITPALKIKNLQFAYPRGREVLHNLSMTLASGERVGLIGPNGAGKTTLFMLICGVLSPGGGTVQLFGAPVQAGQFQPQVGLVFQYPNDQLFAPSVWDDVAFGPLNMGLSEEDVQRRVKTAMAQTGISELAEQAPHHLSGGQKRMVAIAGVQAMQPQLIIYDEPSANLDIRSRRRLIEFMQHAAETIVVASHDLELIVEVCQRVFLLDEGRLIASGPTQEIMQNSPLMEQHGLETPHSLRYHHKPHHQ